MRRPTLVLLAVAVFVVRCTREPTGTLPGDPAGIRVTPSAVTMRAGEDTQLTAVYVDRNGAELDDVDGPPPTFASSNAGVVSVTTAGLVTSPGPAGNATVTVQGLGLEATVPITVGPADVAAVQQVRGDAQTAPQMVPLTDSLVVRVTDRFDNPVPGTRVDWTVALGGGALSPPFSSSNAAGLAASRWTMGCALGDSGRATATVTALTPIPFQATVTPGPVTSLERVAGNAQTDTIGAALRDSLVVRATSGCGTALGGVSINWVAGGGRGNVTPSTSLSNAAGSAAARWTVGTATGTDTVTASATGAAPMRFTATVTSGQPVTFAKVAGDAQSDTISATLRDTLVVRLADRAGNGVPSRSVTWNTASGRGSLAAMGAATDAAGRARARWTVGNLVGSDTASASVSGLPAATFTTAVGAGNPAQVLADSGSGGSVPAGGVKPDSLVARVVDRLGNPRSGQSVNWAAGSGSVTPVSSTTGVTGRARSRWTVGTTASPTPVTATATVASLAPASFTAIVVPGPAVSIRFDSALAVIDSGSSRLIGVTATDQFGNAISRSALTWFTRSAGVASVSTNGQITGLSRGQSVVGATGGAAADSALVAVVPVGGVLVRTNAPFSLRADSQTTLSLLVDMGASGERLGSTAIVITWSTSVLTYVGHAAGSFGSPVVNSANAGSGELRMSLADATGASGLVEILRITYRPVATTGMAGALALAVSELSGAGTFANLLPRTVALTHPVSTR